VPPLECVCFLCLRVLFRDRGFRSEPAPRFHHHLAPPVASQEWLLDVRHKLEPSEYGVVVCTFLAINVAGLNEGLLAGVLAAAVQFLFM